MKSIITCLALCATAYAPVAQAADCTTLQEYYGEWSAAQQALLDFDYTGKQSEAQSQYQSCINNIWRIYGSSGSDAAAQAARDCEDEYNYALDNIEMEYGPLHNEEISTGLYYNWYLGQTLAEGLQCF